jgi:hypothetical protein
MRHLLNSPFKSLPLLLMLAVLIGVGVPAHAQENVYRVEFKLGLTDPDTDHSWYVVRISRVSWGSEKICRDRAAPFITEQIAAVKKFGLVTKNNKPPIVKVTSWRCIH